MTISSYQVDNVLKAYTKQTKVKIKSDIAPQSAKGNVYNDVVSLSKQGSSKEDAFVKISYNLMDIILKNGAR